jgi:chromosome segregation ATPase
MSLSDFKKERDHAATEGSAAGPLSAAQPESQVLTTSLTLMATELERRCVALAQAQETIERLAREAGQYAGRTEVLERELAASRQRVADLEQERDQWQQQTLKLWPTRPPTRRIRLLPWQPREQEESPRNQQTQL